MVTTTAADSIIDDLNQAFVPTDIRRAGTRRWTEQPDLEVSRLPPGEGLRSNPLARASVHPLRLAALRVSLNTSFRNARSGKSFGQVRDLRRQLLMWAYLCVESVGGFKAGCAWRDHRTNYSELSATIYFVIAHRAAAFPMAMAFLSRGRARTCTRACARATREEKGETGILIRGL